VSIAFAVFHRITWFSVQFKKAVLIILAVRRGRRREVEDLQSVVRGGPRISARQIPRKREGGGLVACQHTHPLRLAYSIVPKGCERSRDCSLCIPGGPFGAKGIKGFGRSSSES
jgi:hypothetical protein